MVCLLANCYVNCVFCHTHSVPAWSRIHDQNLAAMWADLLVTQMLIRDPQIAVSGDSAGGRFQVSFSSELRIISNPSLPEVHLKDPQNRFADSSLTRPVDDSFRPK